MALVRGGGEVADEARLRNAPPASLHGRYTPAYLVTEGPYRFSRNPIYLAEGMIWMGWIIFFGSIVILAVFSTLAVVVGPFVLRREEKGLEARFGDAWVLYSKTTPRGSLYAGYGANSEQRRAALRDLSLGQALLYHLKV